MPPSHYPGHLSCVDRPKTPRLSCPDSVSANIFPLSKSKPSGIVHPKMTSFLRNTRKKFFHILQNIFLCVQQKKVIQVKKSLEENCSLSNFKGFNILGVTS